MTDTDKRLAQAQQNLSLALRGLRDAQENVAAAHARVDRARAKRDAADPAKRVAEALRRIGESVAHLTEPSDPNVLDLDDDPRAADEQAAEFFNRAGDYHQVRLQIPIEGDEAEKGGFAGRKIGAQCVIKFTPEQKPLVIEILRQLRGALNARITITRLEMPRGATAPPPPTAHVSVGVGGTSYLGRTGQTEPRYMPPDGSPIPMTEFRLGERYGERERIAEQYGVPLENVRPAASPTGATAWTVTPAAKPTTGRHAAAEIKVDTERALTDIRETRYRVEDLFRANNARWAHGTYTMHRGTRTPIFMAECECGEQFDNPSQDGAKAQWDTHRREAFEAALLDIDDHVNTEGDE